MGRIFFSFLVAWVWFASGKVLCIIVWFFTLSKVTGDGCLLWENNDAVRKIHFRFHFRRFAYSNCYSLQSHSTSLSRLGDCFSMAVSFPEYFNEEGSDKNWIKGRRENRIKVKRGQKNSKRKTTKRGKTKSFESLSGKWKEKWIKRWNIKKNYVK